MKILTILALILSLSLYGCSKCSEETKETKSNTIDSSKEMQKQSVTTDSKYPLPEKLPQTQKTPKYEKNIPAIEPSKLVKYLPKSISGMEKLPPDMGRRNFGGYYWTTASIEHIFKNKGYLIYSITDYGTVTEIPADELKVYTVLPVEPAKTVEKIILPEGTGYIIWDESKRSGTLFGLICKRFGIRIEANKTPAETPGLQYFVKNFKLEEMISQAKGK